MRVNAASMIAWWLENFSSNTAKIFTYFHLSWPWKRIFSHQSWEYWPLVGRLSGHHRHHWARWLSRSNSFRDWSVQSTTRYFCWKNSFSGEPLRLYFTQRGDDFAHYDAVVDTPPLRQIIINEDVTSPPPNNAEHHEDSSSLCNDKSIFERFERNSMEWERAVKEVSRSSPLTLNKPIF